MLLRLATLTLVLSFVAGCNSTALERGPDEPALPRDTISLAPGEVAGYRFSLPETTTLLFESDASSALHACFVRTEQRQAWTEDATGSAAYEGCSDVGRLEARLEPGDHALMVRCPASASEGCRGHLEVKAQP